MAAGYSQRSLVQKLGIKPGTRIIILNPPPAYENTLGPLPEGLEIRQRLSGSFDFIQFFASEYADLARRLLKLKTALAKSGMLWISWPKKASKVDSDITEDRVRALALQHGLVDVKVCAVDETWSGLKLVYRLKDR